VRERKKEDFEMAGFNMGDVLKDILGGDITKMNDQQLAEAIQKVRPPEKKPKLSLGDLMCMPPKEWSSHGVGLVKFIAAEGVTPCKLCAPLVGKCLKTIDGTFYFDNAKQHHRKPFCLLMVPAANGKNEDECDLPPYPEDGSLEVLDFSIPHKWCEDIYNREHPEDDGEDEYVPPIVLTEDAFAAGSYSEFDPEYLYSCVCCTTKSAEDGQDITWLITVLDQAIVGGLGKYTFPRAERLRGDLFLQAGNKVAALAAYRHALSLDPKIGLKRKVAAMEKELGDGKDAGI